MPAAGAHLVVEHERHTSAVLELEPLDGLEILATCFAPGLAPSSSPGAQNEWSGRSPRFSVMRTSRGGPSSSTSTP